ncbi:RDD family protein [Aureisphaera galaxeae]|uniref:RDD family protein n=1 Tax=Aureisphaera galaxeae TaxID=1538023 RepID=UPI00235073BD|nr:RDD family protein [Aureisphaera galaxeae]MDC8003925.1 RDD family protein [Aureisphaera galaxeae]
MSEPKHRGFFYEEISRIANKNHRFHRISSMLLDHIIMTYVIVLPIALVMILGATGVVQLSDRVIEIPFFVVMFIYFNKDFVNGKSPTKRLMGYRVIDRKTEKPATELQCFIRNLVAIAWPIEAIVGFMNPTRRIGDFIANTKVVRSEKQKLKTIWVELKNKEWKWSILLILVVGVVYFYGLNFLMPMPV